MICPKCGFQQPDDIYCVFCGVNIETYLRQKKRRRYKGGILVALIGIIGLSTAYYIISSRRVEISDRAGEEAYKERLAESTQERHPGLESQRSPAERQSLGEKGTENGGGRESRRESPEAHSTARDWLEGDEVGLKSSLDRDEGQDLLEESSEGRTRTASEWFEKGRALDDDSDAEIQCYKKAIEQDAKFAPAYYRLGAIYYRQANYELADEQFTSFLEYASDADKEIYNIYEYYSFADVERLSRGIEEEAAAEEGAGTQEEGEAQKEERETPERTESETEPVSGETSGLETNEEVLTIVNFLPVEGHIMVPVILNQSRQARVLVDTGAGITILSRELAQELGLEAKSDHSITLKTIAMDIQGELAGLDSIQVGGLIRHNFPVAITDLAFGEKSQFDGILGMDFMADYKIHIDNEKRRIVLSPKSQ
jgi:predicted aspartyl protease